MHIVFFNRSYWPDQAATGQLLTELAEDLVRNHGCKVSIVAGLPLYVGQASQQDQAVRPARRDWRLVRKESRNGVEIYRAVGTTFPPRRFVARATNYTSYFLTACWAGFGIPRPDVVVSLTDPPIIGLAALLTARRFRAKFVFLCQDVFPEVASLLEDFQSESVNRLLDWISRFLVRKADRVVALGETMRDRLITGKRANPKKTAVIHNWADCSAIVPGPKRNPLSVSSGLAEDFVVMHSGNVGMSQSLDTLLAASERLYQYEGITLAVVGNGAKREALEEQARAKGLSNIRFFPYQPKDNLKDSFASADVFIVSLKRGLAGYIVPSKLYGILAAGRPYVAAVEDACEVAAITRQYECGLLAKPEDPNDLAEKILTLSRDHALARRLGANARQAALQFDRPGQVQAYHELFRELVGVA